MVMRDGRTAGYFDSIGEVSRAAAVPMFFGARCSRWTEDCTKWNVVQLFLLEKFSKVLGSYKEDQNRKSIMEKCREIYIQI
ncbi:hypothetical protein CEXT_682251 [Caerostris extrusa]|uniref:Uncharacterized protein n=1 Tax=Caerostris extrusa TaxID=172846 RepID=A0AAV4YD53_CAEEX|nr:hypothetical protein CEXT_682251 [Caerostris extrusa]